MSSEPTTINTGTQTEGLNLDGVCLTISAPASDVDIPVPGGAAVLANANKLWENGQEITYAFLSGSPIEQQKVTEIIAEWSLYANLTFKLVPKYSIKKAEDAMIRVDFDRNDGSWSLVGRDALTAHIDPRRPWFKMDPKTVPTLNLGWLDLGKDITEKDRGVVLHEFGHAIGLDHEHQSPAKSGVLTLNEKWIIEAYAKSKNKWSEKETRAQIITVLKEGEYSNYTELDTKSIMMYPMVKQMTTQGVEVPINNKLSEKDKAFMLIHYPIFDFSDRTDGWSFEKALDVLGITGSAKDAVVEKYESGNVSEIRAEFARHYESVREERQAQLAQEFNSGK